MKIIRPLLLSIGILSGTALLLLVILSLLYGKTGKLPGEMAPLLTTLTACAAVFLGSWIASAAAREKGILIGLGSAGFVTAVMALVSLVILRNPFQLSALWKIAALFLSGGLGGILGVNRKSKVKF